MKGIARLAQELGISTGTVSRALNGKPDVSEETRQKVLEAARRRGYAPNQAARSLAQGTTRAVGFVIELGPGGTVGFGYFVMGVCDGVQSVLRQHGLDLFVLPCPTDQDRHAFLERLVARGVVDGIILAATRRVDPSIEFLQSSGLPFVAFGRSTSGHGYSWIDLDFETVANVAVDRLVAAGHRRIALTVPSGDLNFGTVFKDAYRGALARHGLPYDRELVFVTRLEEAAGYALVDDLLRLDDRPTAIVLVYEIAAIGIYRRLAERGLEPGKDLAVIGFRDEPAIRFLAPSLTTFSISLHDIGVALGTALVDQIPQYAGHSAQRVAQVLCPLSLRPGDSDRFAPAATRARQPDVVTASAAIRL
jgi:DNA-binding LacI/PurR family transcriptional regulator